MLCDVRASNPPQKSSSGGGGGGGFYSCAFQIAQTSNMHSNRTYSSSRTWEVKYVKLVEKTQMCSVHTHELDNKHKLKSIPIICLVTVGVRIKF